MTKAILLLILFAAGHAVVSALPYDYYQCPHLYNPSYGSVTTSGYSYGSTARYYCQNGYSMYSSQNGLYPQGSYYLRTCMQGGIWSGILPQCGMLSYRIIIIFCFFISEL